MNQIILLKHPYTIYQGKDGRWRTYIIENGKRRMIVRKHREDLEEYLSSIYIADNSATIETLYPDWIRYKQTDVSKPTIRKYNDAWARHYAGEDIIITPITSLKRIDIEIWANRQIDKYKLTRKAYNNMIVVAHGILDYAVDLELIEHNPARDIRVRRGKLHPERKKADDTQVFSTEELYVIKTQCYKDFNDDIYPVNSLVPLAVVFLFLTGLRVGELAVINYNDVINDTLTVQRMYRAETNEVIDRTKGTFGVRTVPLTEEALEIITLARQRQAQRAVKTNYIFSMDKGPAPYNEIKRAFYKYSKKTGLKRSSHKARKTYISALIDAGVNINTVRQVAGHVDERTTLHSYTYDRSDDETKKQAIKNALEGHKELSIDNPK